MFPITTFYHRPSQRNLPKQTTNTTPYYTSPQLIPLVVTSLVSIVYEDHSVCHTALKYRISGEISHKFNSRGCISLEITLRKRITRTFISFFAGDCWCESVYIRSNCTSLWPSFFVGNNKIKVSNVISGK